MRAPRDTAVGLDSTFSTTARSTSKVVSSTLRTPASTAASSSSRAARGSVVEGSTGGGAAATGEAGRGTSPPISEMRSSRCEVAFSKSRYLPRMRVTVPASGMVLPTQ
jgi:hypothetical protein